MSRTMKQHDRPKFSSIDVASTLETRKGGGSSPTHFPFLLPPVMPDEIGRLGAYRVLRLLGQGGMGYVFEAEDEALRRPVALKVMKPQFDADEAGCERFLREARLMASIKHDHVVTVFQVGRHERTPYLAMELLRGKSLEDWMKKSPKIGVSVVLRLGRQIASGLAVIHGRGLIHRDIKPANIWLEAPKGRVKILDFGLARVAEDDARLTQSGMIVGTPSYMSPEQARGESLDARSDLFSLGCVLYEMCSGVRPFQASTTMAVLTALATKAPRPVHELRINVPPDFSDLIMRLLAKAPTKRLASADEVVAELQRIESGLNVRPTARVSRSPVQTQLPTKLKTPVRIKKLKLRSTRRARSPFVHGVLLTAIIMCAAILTFLTMLLWFSSGRHNAAPLPAAQLNELTPAVYLSELKPIEDRNPLKAPPPPPPNQPPPPPPGQRSPPPNQPPPPGQPPPFFLGVKVHDQLSPHGIFMHPPMQANGGEAGLSYSLARKYLQFNAETSLNDGPPQSETPLTFSVLGDGRLLWQSHPIRTQADAERCMVSVKGVNVLTIQVHCPGPPRGAHAVWIEPKATP